MGDIALGFADGIRQSGVGNLYERANEFQKSYVDMANSTAQTELNRENLRLARENATLDRAFKEKEFALKAELDKAADARAAAAEGRAVKTFEHTEEDRPKQIEALQLELDAGKARAKKAELDFKISEDAFKAAPEDRRLEREMRKAQIAASEATTAAQKQATELTAKQAKLAEAAYAEAALTKPGEVTKTLLTSMGNDLTVLDPATRATTKSARIATRLALMQTSMTDKERESGAAALAAQVEREVETEMQQEQGFAWFLWNTSHDALKDSGAGAASLAAQIKPQALQDFVNHQARVYINKGATPEDRAIRTAAVGRVRQTGDASLGSTPPSSGAAKGGAGAGLVKSSRPQLAAKRLPPDMDAFVQAASEAAAAQQAQDEYRKQAQQAAWLRTPEGQQFLALTQQLSGQPPRQYSVR